MNVQVKLHRTRSGGRQVRRAAVERRQISRPDSEAQLRRAREAGQSQDEAQYRCKCGFVFRELVSTSVHCPHCGSTQAW